MKEYFKCQDNIEELKLMKPVTVFLLVDVVNYCLKQGLPCVLTSLVRDPDKISESETHQEGRAFDLSVKGWDVQEIDECVLYFNKKHANIGAVRKDGKVIVALAHDNGNGNHIHFQTRRNLEFL